MRKQTCGSGRFCGRGLPRSGLWATNGTSRLHPAVSHPKCGPMSNPAWMVVCLSLLSQTVLLAQSSADTNAVWLAERYTKYEYRIPTRDGIRLMTRVYVPKDDSQPWPILLTRTPYALKPYGDDNFNDAG